MPLPFLLAGAALAAAGYGVKKGSDAVSDFSDASDTNKRAQRIYDKANTELETAKLHAQNSLETLGTLKFEIIENSIVPFVDTFEKIKNINFDDIDLIGTNLPSVTVGEMNNMEKENLELKELVGGGISSLGTGGLAGLAAYGGVGLLGTASTGTAIGTLSGAAATNATLAWLGGGSIASGGFGMAGGMAVLGGIVAGPVLAVGGMMAASKAEAAKENAYANLSQARIAVEEMETASVMTHAIQRRFDEMASVLMTLNEYFSPLLISLQELVSVSTDYSSYSKEDKKGVFMAASTAKTLKNILEVDILKEDGSLTKKSKKAVKRTTILLEDLNCKTVDVEKNIISLETLLEKHEEILTDDSYIYFGWRIPYKKSKNAIDAYAHPDSEIDDDWKVGPDGDCLVLFDSTIFGSATEGFFLTEDELYFKAMFEDRIYFNIKDIYSIWLDTDECNLHINGEECNYTHSEINRPMKIIVDCINTYIEQF